MATNFETIWDALVERLKSETRSFPQRIVRREHAWGLEQLPAIEVYDNGDETDLGDEDDPQPRWRASGEIWILAQTKESDVSPLTQINALVYEVRQALERKKTDPVPDGQSTFWTDLGIAGLTLSVARVTKGLGQKTGVGMAKIDVNVTTY